MPHNDWRPETLEITQGAICETSGGGRHAAPDLLFGFCISSSWGNGHATLWCGLCRALGRLGHHVTFFERDVPYYAENRDLTTLPRGEIVLYPSWEEVRPLCEWRLAAADVGIVTSYCPDAIAATELLLASRIPLRVFYDLDPPP